MILKISPMTWLILLVMAAGLAAVGNSLLSKPEEAVNLPQPKRSLLLVSLRQAKDPESQLLEWAADCLAAELGLEVSIRPQSLLLPQTVFHHRRGQADAVDLVGRVEGLVTPHCAVLGLTEYDLHSPLRRDLTFCMGARKGWAGLVSSFRMADRSPENTQARLAKMLIRYGAELCCDAQRDQDRCSVFYEGLQQPEQLDIMNWPPEAGS